MPGYPNQVSIQDRFPVIDFRVSDLDLIVIKIIQEHNENLPRNLDVSVEEPLGEIYYEIEISKMCSAR